MAVLALSLAGASAAGALGISASIGYAVGAYVGNALFNKPPTIKNEGPRLNDLKFTSSATNEVIALHWGTNRLKGNVIDATEIKEKQNKTSQRVGGKNTGGQKVESTTYSYSITLAIAICRGEINAIKKIYCNSELVQDLSDNNSGITNKLIYDNLEIFTGTNNQETSAILEEINGIGNTPAYNNIAYIVIKNLQLENFGNRVPNFEFEVTRGVGGENQKFDKDDLRPNLFNNTAGNTVKALEFNNFDDYLYILENNGSQSGLHKINVAQNMTIEKSYISPNLVSSNNELGGNTFKINVLQDGNIAIVNNYSSNNFYEIIDTQTMNLIKTVNELSFQNYIDYPFAPGSARIGNKIIYSNKTNQYLSLNVYQQSIPASTDIDCNLIFHKFNRKDGQGFEADIFESIKFIMPINYKNSCINPDFDGWCLDSATDTFYSVQYGGQAGDYNLYLSLFNNGYMINNYNLLKNNVSEQYIFDDIIFDNISRCVIIKYKQSSDTLSRFIKIDVDTNTIIDEINLNTILPAGTYTEQKKITLNNRKIFITAPTATLTLEYAYLIDLDTFLATFEQVAPNPTWGADIPNAQSFYNYSYINDIGAYCSFRNFYILKYFGKRFADLEYNLADLVSEICVKSGLNTNQIDVSDLATKTVKGYSITSNSTARGALEQLAKVFNFQQVEQDYKIKFLFNGSGSVKTINQKELGAQNYGPDISFEELFKTTSIDEFDLPEILNFSYLDKNKDYQINTQSTRRVNVNTNNILNSEIPIVLTSSEAKQVVDRLMFSTWISRYNYEFSTNYNLIDVMPNDVLTIERSDNGGIYKVKITKREDSGGILKYSAISEDSASYTQLEDRGETGSVTTKNISKNSKTKTYFLDIPILQNNDDDAGFYVGVKKLNNNYDWSGSILLSANDNNSNFSSIKDFYKEIKGGTTISQLTNFGLSNYFELDSINFVDVEIFDNTQIFSINDNDFYNYENLALINNELICFKNVTLISANKYRLSGLLRGLFGTEDEMINHSLGDRFILLKKDDSITRIQRDLSNQNNLKYYKNVSFGNITDEAQIESFFNESNGLKCYPVCNVVSTRDGNNNINFSFNKRVRGFQIWQNYNDVIDVDFDNYEIDIYTDSNYTTFKRTITITNQTKATYTSDDQLADFGANQSIVYIKIYKLNKYMQRGKVKLATI